MKTFTDLKAPRKINQDIETIFDGDYIKVKTVDGWEFVEDSDCVVVLPHLVNFDEIILRKEVIPAFNTREPNPEHFLTVVSGTMEAGEDPTETLIREVREETGMMLNTGFQGWKKWGEYFWSKGSNSKCHLYYLPLTMSDFQRVAASGDGSELEANSKSVRVDMEKIDSLRPSDLVSELLLMKLKEEIRNNQ